MITVKNKDEMWKYSVTIDTEYLLGLDSAEERRELCQDLLESAKQYPDITLPDCWQDCVNNPGVYNELKYRRDNE